DVVDEFARNRILVRRQAERERAHRPLRRRPVQRRETRAEPERALAEFFGGGRENRARGIFFLREIFQLQQIREGRRENRRAVRERFAAVERGRVFRGEFPRAVAGRRIFQQHKLTRRRREPALLINFH